VRQSPQFLTDTALNSFGQKWSKIPSAQASFLNVEAFTPLMAGMWILVGWSKSSTLVDLGVDLKSWLMKSRLKLKLSWYFGVGSFLFGVWVELLELVFIGQMPCLFPNQQISVFYSCIVLSFLYTDCKFVISFNLSFGFIIQMFYSCLCFANTHFGLLCITCSWLEFAVEHVFSLLPHVGLRPLRFLVECRKKQLNQGSFVLLYFVLFAFSEHEPTLVHAGKYGTEDLQTLQKLDTAQRKQTTQNKAIQNYPGSVASYDTRGSSPTAVQAWQPLVTPYNCRLGDLLCLFVYAVFVCYFVTVCVCICVICVFFVFFALFSFTAFSFSTLILLVGSFDP